MKKLSVFEFVTLNGFYKGPNEDISWHRHGGEEAQLSEEGLEQNNILLFGRKTYDVMVSFWPTPMAKQSMPKVAEGMNKAQKIVFSTTMKKADWQNTSVVREKIVEETKRLKQTAARDLTVLGSGTIVTQLAEAGLIDEYQIMIDPVLIGEGTPLFEV